MKKQFKFASVKVLFIFLFSLGLSNFSSAKCVYLKPLNIKKMDMGNMLSWQTTEEIDIQSFVIQTSSNGIDFKNLGDVNGSGFSKKVTSYRFLDLYYSGEKTYYRLLHVAADGSFTISETFFIEQSNNPNWMVSSVNSTITNDQLDLTVFSKNTIDINYEVQNKSGRVVKRGTHKAKSGNNTISINCNSFSKGTYKVVLKNGSSKANINIKKVMANEMPPIEYVVVHM